MRLFLALNIPQEVSDGLVEALDNTQWPRVRIVPRHLWHITLAFLGDVPEVDIELIVNTCKRFQTCPGTMTLDRLETFPHTGPKLLAGLCKETTRDTWKAFIEELRGDMLTFSPEMDRKSWRPHITVGKGPEKGVLERWGADIGPWTWTPGGFSLMESVVTEESHNYRTIHEFPFTN